MQSENSSFVTYRVAWGKLNGSDAWHPLTDHMLDVAACFHAIAQTPACKRSLEKAAGWALTNLDLMRLTALAFLHDIGKANAGFQAKRWSHINQRAPQGWPAPAGHSSEAMCIFGNAKLLGELPTHEMRNWGAACMSLWRASISHHGRPVEDNIDSLSASLLWRPVLSAGKVVYDPKTTLGEIGQCLKKWFAQAFEAGPPLPDNPEFAHLFAGLVQLADWLGSDMRLFPYLRQTTHE